MPRCPAWGCGLRGRLLALILTRKPTCQLIPVSGSATRYAGNHLCELQRRQRRGGRSQVRKPTPVCRCRITGTLGSPAAAGNLAFGAWGTRRPTRACAAPTRAHGGANLSWPSGDAAGVPPAGAAAAPLPAPRATAAATRRLESPPAALPNHAAPRRPTAGAAAAAPRAAVRCAAEAKQGELTGVVFEPFAAVKVRCGVCVCGAQSPALLSAAVPRRAHRPLLLAHAGHGGALSHVCFRAVCPWVPGRSRSWRWWTARPPAPRTRASTTMPSARPPSMSRSSEPGSEGPPGRQGRVVWCGWDEVRACCFGHRSKCSPSAPWPLLRAQHRVQRLVCELAGHAMLPCTCFRWVCLPWCVCLVG